MESRAAGSVTPCWGALRRTRFVANLFLLALVLVATSCSKPSRQDPISAKDDGSFALWLSRHAEVFSPEDIKEINTARQQIRYKVMQARPGLPPDEAMQSVYAEINGQTVQELLRTGYALQIERMKTELQNYEPLVAKFRAGQRNNALADDQKQYASDSLEK